jgi:hypothetical protein
MSRANKLMAMAKDISGFHPITVSKVFFQFLIVPLSYSFKDRFKNTYPPINLEYRPLEAMKPSFLTSEPSSTHTLIKPWCKLMSKTLLITFFKYLFSKNCVMPRGLWWALTPRRSFICFHPLSNFLKDH